MSSGSHPDLDHYAHIPTALDNVTAASVWHGGDTDAYSSANFPGWLAKQQTGGAILHRNFPASITIVNPSRPISPAVQIHYLFASLLVTHRGSCRGPTLLPLSSI